jgi:hypothetical protein
MDLVTAKLLEKNNKAQKPLHIYRGHVVRYKINLKTTKKFHDTQGAVIVYANRQ